MSERKELSAVDVMSLIQAQYQFYKDRNDNKLYDDSIRQDECLEIMRLIIDADRKLNGQDDDDMDFDLLDRAVDLAVEDGVKENKQVGCFDEDHF